MAPPLPARETALATANNIPPAPAPAPSGWNCNVCNAYNPDYRLVCSAKTCGAPRNSTIINRGENASNTGPGRDNDRPRRDGKPRKSMYDSEENTETQLTTMVVQGCLVTANIKGWTCTACGNFNYGQREVCNMRRCGAARPPKQTPQTSQ